MKGFRYIIIFLTKFYSEWNHLHMCVKNLFLVPDTSVTIQHVLQEWHAR